MEVAATNQAAAPVRQYTPRKNSMAREVLEYCAVPRDMNEIVDWLGESANAVTRLLASRGQLVNLRPARGIGVYVDAKRVPLHVEQIVWYSPAKCMPDSDITVQLSVRGNSEPAWPGYRDGDVWRWVDGSPVLGEVIAWADMPAGPEGA